MERHDQGHVERVGQRRQVVCVWRRERGEEKCEEIDGGRRRRSVGAGKGRWQGHGKGENGGGVEYLGKWGFFFLPFFLPFFLFSLFSISVRCGQ